MLLDAGELGVAFEFGEPDSYFDPYLAPKNMVSSSGNFMKLELFFYQIASKTLMGS